MHEMSLCESIIQIIEEEARQHGFARVQAVHLEIGALAGVEIPAMEFSFDVVRRGTVAEDARLVIHTIPGTAWCMGCDSNVEVRERLQACPKCGSWRLQVTGGEDLRIRHLEVDDRAHDEANSGMEHEQTKQHTAGS